MGGHTLFELPSHEVLSQLANDDPQAFEALRRELIENFIDCALVKLKARLSGIQFRVDSERRLSRSSALGATVRVYTLMWESFLCLNHSWQDFVCMENEFEDMHESTSPTECVPKVSAQILEFRPRPHM